MFDTMGLFSFLKGGSTEPKGLIAYLGLCEWFSSITHEDKCKVREYFNGLGFNPKDLDAGNTSFGSTTQSIFFNGIAYNAIKHKDYVFAEKMFSESLQSKEISVIDRHFTYNNLIDFFYKQRKSSPDAIENCVKYCLKDIQILEEFLNTWKKKYEKATIPRIPSIQRLIIIYEKQGKLEECIKICDMGIKLGLPDSTKGGFEERRIKLLMKLNQ